MRPAPHLGLYSGPTSQGRPHLRDRRRNAILREYQSDDNRSQLISILIDSVLKAESDATHISADQFEIRKPIAIGLYCAEGFDQGFVLHGCYSPVLGSVGMNRRSLHNLSANGTE